jgi:hypothetical protein
MTERARELTYAATCNFVDSPHNYYKRLPAARIEIGKRLIITPNLRLCEIQSECVCDAIALRFQYITSRIVIVSCLFDETTSIPQMPLHHVIKM